MNHQSGLPDYVRDHFDYLVRSPAFIRLSQAVFFVSGLILPLMLLLALPDIEGNKMLSAELPLILAGSVFAVTLVLYLSWIQIQRLRFRKERPESYRRWFGWRQRRLGSNLSAQTTLLRMQMQYVFFGREPSDSETLELTMQFLRRIA